MINPLAIIVAAVVSTVIGLLWYSPALFGSTWRQEVGLGPRRAASLLAGKIVWRYFLNFVISLIIAYTLAILLEATGSSSSNDALGLTGLVWLGLVSMTKLSEVVFGGKSVKLYLIDVGYFLFSLVASALIIFYL